MASLKSAFEAYAEELLADASPETVKAAEEAFMGGALLVLRQVENPARSFAQQRNRLRSIAGEINEFHQKMMLEEAKRGSAE